jgi:[ribosomal protein S5]-alanine N-acetyltransferase
MISIPRTIGTERLILVPCDKNLLQVIIQGDKPLAAHLDITIAPNWAHFGTGPFQYTLDILNKDHDEKTYLWWAYLIVHRRENKLIGNGGFKGRPDDRGIVEIGYAIAPEYRTQGLATEAAGALLDHAFSFKAIKIVQAHTLAEKNESNHILKKLGMAFMEEKLDAEEGSIWRFAKGR